MAKYNRCDNHVVSILIDKKDYVTLLKVTLDCGYVYLGNKTGPRWDSITDDARKDIVSWAMMYAMLDRGYYSMDLVRESGEPISVKSQS